MIIQEIICPGNKVEIKTFYVPFAYDIFGSFDNQLAVMLKNTRQVHRSY